MSTEKTIQIRQAGLVALCLVLASCGGGRTDGPSARDRELAAQAADAPASTSVAGSNRRATPLAATPSKGTGRPGDPLIPTPIPARSASQQSAAEITRLEQQDALPKLDRSTDLRGPDANSNGVRDDVEAYIAMLTLKSWPPSQSIRQGGCHRIEQSKHGGNKVLGRRIPKFLR